MSVVRASFLLSHCKGKLMGLDVGTKRIGLAISDSDRLISFPYKVVEFNKGIAGVRTELHKICEKENVKGVVAGWPLLQSGQAGSQCKFVAQFIKDIDLPVPVTIWDERYSSQMSKEEHLFGDPDYQKFEPKRRSVDYKMDSYAASTILQTLLDCSEYGGDVDECFGDPKPMNF